MFDVAMRGLDIGYKLKVEGLGTATVAHDIGSGHMMWVRTQDGKAHQLDTSRYSAFMNKRGEFLLQLRSESP